MSQKTNSSKKNNKEDGMLPKMELLIIFVFFMSFIVWAMSKCNATQAQYAQEANEVPTKVEETTIEEPVITKPSEDNKNLPKKTTTPIKTVTEKVTVLYVTLDGLKLRKGHHLDSSIVRTLKLNDEVYFLNEVTDFKQKINLGDQIAIEPWIKVRSYTGHEGWVYGAGVHYFKSKPSIDTLSE